MQGTADYNHGARRFEHCPECNSPCETIHFAGRLTDEYCSRWPADCAFWTHYEDDGRAVIYARVSTDIDAGRVA